MDHEVLSLGKERKQRKVYLTEIVANFGYEGRFNSRNSYVKKVDPAAHWLWT
jgi:hypothetical protein